MTVALYFLTNSLFTFILLLLLPTTDHLTPQLFASASQLLIPQ